MQSQRTVAELYAAAKAGDRAALARLLSCLDRGGDETREIARLSCRDGGHAYTVGLTGAPGAGKSTLASAVIAHMRRRDLEVAVLVVDPSSPLTGGAILGDRVRMHEHTSDPGVFIRSLATRGSLGGLALLVSDAVRVLDAARRKWIMLETVGVGQIEVDIAGKADTTIFVVNPGSGDAVQANKAGLTEVADVFVINKADRAGVDEARRDLDLMLDLSGLGRGDWRPPICSAVATTGAGVAEVWEAVVQHRAHLEATGELQRRREHRLREELREIVVRRLEQRAREIATDRQWHGFEAGVVARTMDPHTAADAMLEGVGA